MSSKAALEAQMRGLAFDLKPRGITCNSVAPCVSFRLSDMCAEICQWAGVRPIMLYTGVP
jgi:NAD(P)-dependent dehydrogenase (short-subunit alcohol dehydrogenase family)